MERIICLVIGYACGLLQSGYLVGKMHHIDIRKAGSGNSGSTNALRVMGLKAGLMTFAGDVLKCFAAVLIVRAIYHGSNILPLLMMYAGAGVTLGHNFTLKEVSDTLQVPIDIVKSSGQDLIDAILGVAGPNPTDIDENQMKDRRITTA